MSHKTAILLASHILHDSVIERLYKISQSSHYDFFILHHSNCESITEKYKHNLFSFTDNILFDLGYQPLVKSILPGSNHFALLQFFQQNRKYQYYWYVEDDVYYNGDWSTFFNQFHSEDWTADFISSYVTDYHDQPTWLWWPYIKYNESKISNAIKTRSFNPIYRISNHGLDLLDKKLKGGWMGHHEVVIPTLLKLGGMKIIDFGGMGKYVLPGFSNRFYKRDDANIMNDTMRYRPEIQPSEITDKLLYHPLKIYRF